MSKNQSTRLGQYITSSAGGENVKAFIPPVLPPSPPLDLAPLQKLMERATASLSRLDGMGSLLPDISLFLYMYVRKEAVLSSQIEGTQSSLSDLLAYENNKAPGIAAFEETREVSCYVAAMDHGLKRLEEGFPLSLRLLRETHAILLKDTRGGNKNPGQFRTSQNWIGGTRPGNALFVPPPPQELIPALDALEKFLHDENDNLPILIKAALIHLQFETIHPFLDGNGRIGRLLITLILCANGLLQRPLLYLSLYLKTHRQTYYSLLNEVREHGTWETWLEFFLTGIHETAEQATDAMIQILALFKTDRALIEERKGSQLSILRIHEWLQKKPFTTPEHAQTGTGLSYATANNALMFLEKNQIVKEITGGKRNRIFVYKNYLDILSKGTEPIPENTKA